MDLKEINILGSDISKHWYYFSKSNAMLKLLEKIKPSTVLDVGAGSGFFSRQLLARTSAESAWCVDISYDRDSDSSEVGKPIHFRSSIQSVDADLVLLMDVLEHIDDDVGLLKEYSRKVPKKSLFLISVPAFQFLWSGHDVFLDHKRRYSLHQLEDTVTAAGLRVNRSSYYFGIVLPIAAVTRLRQKCFRRDNYVPKSQLTRHHPLVNFILKVFCYSELPLMKFNRFAGLSVFCLAEKI